MVLGGLLTAKTVKITDTDSNLLGKVFKLINGLGVLKSWTKYAGCFSEEKGFFFSMRWGGLAPVKVIKIYGQKQGRKDVPSYPKEHEKRDACPHPIRFALLRGHEFLI
jgi:hypothetical protein